MLHFAYGSNLLIERIRLPERCPGARPVCVARLVGWRLAFEKRGTDGSGKATVRPDLHGIVHGVLYDLPADERVRLDRVEGSGYRPHEVRVHAESGPQAAWLYLGIELDEGMRPFRWYRDLVIAGARQHRLPASYAAAIAAVVAQADPDRSRAERMQRVLDTAGSPW